MRTIVSRRPFSTIVLLLIVFGASAILLLPHAARAFTLPSDFMFFDPISVSSGQTVHLHVVNVLTGGPIIIRTFVRPTNPALGSPVAGPTVTLNAGDGSDQTFPFAGFSPPLGTDRIPVVVFVFVSVPTGMPPNDWSGRVASSIEIVEDTTNRPTQILASRHIVVKTNPCTSCN
jgi:hypothetical protein